MEGCSQAGKGGGAKGRKEVMMCAGARRRAWRQHAGERCGVLLNLSHGLVGAKGTSHRGFLLGGPTVWSQDCWVFEPVGGRCTTSSKLERKISESTKGMSISSG